MEKDGIEVEINCLNGYLSVQVLLKYEYLVQSGTQYVYDGYSKVYDLYTGKELEFSDLFYKNVDFISTLNQSSQKQLGKQMEFSEVKETKRTFAGIPKNISIFGFNKEYSYSNNITIAYTKYNEYFVEGELFNFDLYCKEISVIYEARDMKDIWEDSVKINKEICINNATKETQEINQKDIIFYVYHTDTNNQAVDKKVNDIIDDYVKKIDVEYIKSAIKKYNQKNHIEDETNDSYYNTYEGKYQVTINVITLGRKKACISIYLGFEMDLETVLVDLETGNISNIDSSYNWIEEQKKNI